MIYRSSVRIFFIIALTLTLAGCNFGRQPAATPLPLTISTPQPNQNLVEKMVTVQRGDVVDTRVFPGKAALGKEEELFFIANGRIQDIHVESGDVVSAGALIAELNTRDLGYDIDLAEKNVKLASLQLEKVRQMATYNLEDAQRDLTIAELRLRKLQESSDASPIDIQIQTLQVERAQAALERLEAGLDTNAAYDVDRLTVLYEQAQTSLEKVQAALEDAQITAPFAGQVRFFDNLVEGEAAKAYEPVGTVVDPESLLVEANLVAEDLELLYEGMPVRVRLPNRAGRELPAQVARLPQPFGGGVGAATQVTLVNEEDKQMLRPGASVELLVEVERIEDALWLPPDAIRGFEGNYYVELNDAGVIRETPITIGLRTDEQVQILSGLEEGDEVLSK